MLLELENVNQFIFLFLILAWDAKFVNATTLDSVSGIWRQAKSHFN